MHACTENTSVGFVLISDSVYCLGLMWDSFLLFIHKFNHSPKWLAINFAEIVLLCSSKHDSNIIFRFSKSEFDF